MTPLGEGRALPMPASLRASVPAELLEVETTGRWPWQQRDTAAS